ncbi:MAG TPA: protealysin inhibitor emfourin [Actinophytocola sp.]|uniref:protealysin inhibitor emfourin n=1 Tax=Actinophytocola sp. TaxID=1872138 RepID=UPI002DFCCEF0|nr:protealysin inhibitor emfourin [Actinophytocola sp.]
MNPGAEGGDLRLRFEMDGGFAYIPALAEPLEVDTATIDPTEAATLRTLLTEAHFFSLPARPEAPARGADQRTFTITATEAGRTHTITLTEPIRDPALAQLVDHLRQRQREAL